MGLPTSLLTEDETLVLDLRPHWIALAPRTVIVAGSAILWLVSSAYSGWFADASSYVLAVATIASFAFFSVSFLKWITTNFAVTSERLILRRGVIAKNGVEIPLDRINTVFFQQSIFERVVGAGDLIVESASEQGRQVFSNIDNPVQVQQTIYRCREGLEDSSRQKNARAMASAMPATGSAADELIKLKSLLDSGVISQEEFHKMKARLIS